MSLQEKKDEFISKDLNKNMNNKIFNPYLKIIKSKEKLIKLKDEEIIKLKEELKAIKEKIMINGFLSDEDCFRLVYEDNYYSCLYKWPDRDKRKISQELDIARYRCKICEYNISLREIKKLIEEGPTFYIPFCLNPDKHTRGGMPTSDLKKMYCPKLMGNISIEKCEQCKYFELIEIKQKKRKKKKIINKIKS